MTRFITIISFLLVLMLVPSSSNAQKLYISTDIGLGIGSSFDTDANDTDFPTLCDKHVDPGNLFSSEGVTEPEGCSDEGSTWSNSFDGSTGIIAGVALGFSTNFGARIEAEYFNLGTQYNEKSILTFEGVGPDVQKKIDEELARYDERIGGVNINSLFINVYYDLPVSGQLRPYVGGGVGFGMAEVEYDGVFAREDDVSMIGTATGATYNGDGNEEADRVDLHKRLAGTTTTASHTLEDTVFGYQAVVGVDYMLTESASIGVKGRWVKYAKFGDTNEWDQLRSHASNNGEGTNTVVYTIETDDLSAFGVSLVMKYAF